MDKKLENITPSGPSQEIPTPTVKPFDDEPNDTPMTSKSSKFKKIILPILAIFLIVVVILGLVVGLPAYKTYSDAKKAYALGMSLKEATKSQDLKKMKESMVATREQVEVVRSDLKALAWTAGVPFVGSYTSDAVHLAAAGQYGLEAGEIVVTAIEPYSDLLGLKGGSTAALGTTEDRIAKMIQTLEKITPQIDNVAVKMELVKKELDAVDPNRYPEEFQGKKIRSQIIAGKELVNLSSEFLTEAKPLTKQLPTLLGMNGEAKYMVLFQNDKELRPTGGFITAYAVFRVEKGKISLDSSDDIYKLDDTVTAHVTPPDPISRYLNVYGWRLRDANFSPDYASSSKTFLDIYKSSKQHKDVKGVIAVDTITLVKMMEVLGPVNIYGTNFTTQTDPSCNCPMVVYELLKQAGQPRGYWVDNRKDMIGLLLQAVMKKAMDAPSQMNAQLFQTGMKMAKEKHLLFYLINQDGQKGIEALGFAGRIKDVPGSDYLHINDANLGGAKSNLYISQSVKKETTITDGGAETVLTIDYRYPHGADNCSLERKEGLCLAGIYRDYLRIYLPLGATVTQMRGFENKGQTSQDLGHTVVAGYFTVVPKGLAKVIIRYKVPGKFKASGKYDILIQKQPGTDANHYKQTVNGQVEEFDLLEDKQSSIRI